MSRVKTKYVGTVEAIQFIRKYHGMFRLPKEELFAFAQEAGTEDELYVLVSERDGALEVVGCRYAEDLGLNNRQYDTLMTRVLEEACTCHIAPPYSVTIANRSGVCSYPQTVQRKRAVA